MRANMKDFNAAIPGECQEGCGKVQCGRGGVKKNNAATKKDCN
jgi:hypothetical protein